MSTMTKTALSDCSYPESTAYNIRDDIDATITRLKVVIDEEASLRKVLRTLFVKRREEAIEQVRLANLHLDLVNEEETAFCDDLMKAAPSANEGLEGSESRESIKQDKTTMPMTHGTTGDHSFSKRLADNSWDADAPVGNPPISPANSTHEICNSPPIYPEKSMHRFDSPSPPCSAYALANEPTGTPGRATDDEDIYSILSLRSSTLARYAKSPPRSTQGLERLPRTPVYSTPRLANDPLPLPPTQFNGVVYSRDIPQRTPTRSARGLEDDYLYLAAGPSQGTPGKTHITPPAFHFGETYGLGSVEPEKSPALSAAALPAAFAFGVGFDATPMADTGFGFNISPTANTGCGFGGGPVANTGFAFGVDSLPTATRIDFSAVSPGNNDAVLNHHLGEELDLVYEHADVVRSSVGFGETIDGQYYIQTPPARELSPVPELPEEPVVVAKPNPKKFKKKHGGKPNLVTPYDTVEPLQEDTQPAREMSPIPALPEEPDVVVVMPNRKKKKLRKGSNLNMETPCEVEPDVYPSVEPLQDVDPETAYMADLDPPEDPHFVAVAPGKSKKGKKKKGDPKPDITDTVIAPSPLEVYLSDEEASLARTQSGLNRYRENVKTLLQLIEKFENPRTVTTGPLENDSGSLGERTAADTVQLIENNVPTEEDIAILKERLVDEEGKVRLYSKIARVEESRIASYRRLIAASSS